MMLRRALAVTGFLALLASGLIFAFPATRAVTTVQVSIPAGAGSGPSAAPGYAPDKIVVVIGVNNTVEWTNNDVASGTHHTVTASLVPTGASTSKFNSGDMAPGATYNYTFTVPGTYDYYCIYHSWMTGTVTVLAATSATTTTAEFPAAWLAFVLFAIFAIAVAASPRLRPTFSKAIKGQ